MYTFAINHAAYFNHVACLHTIHRALVRHVERCIEWDACFEGFNDAQGNPGITLPGVSTLVQWLDPIGMVVGLFWRHGIRPSVVHVRRTTPGFIGIVCLERRFGIAIYADRFQLLDKL